MPASRARRRAAVKDAQAHPSTAAEGTRQEATEGGAATVPGSGDPNDMVRGAHGAVLARRHRDGDLTVTEVWSPPATYDEDDKSPSTEPHAVLVEHLVRLRDLVEALDSGDGRRTRIQKLIEEVAPCVEGPDPVTEAGIEEACRRALSIALQYWDGLPEHEVAVTTFDPAMKPTWGRSGATDSPDPSRVRVEITDGVGNHTAIEAWVASPGLNPKQLQVYDCLRASGVDRVEALAEVRT